MHEHILFSSEWAAVAVAALSGGAGAFFSGLAVFLRTSKAQATRCELQRREQQARCDRQKAECHGEAGFLEHRVYLANQATYQAEMKIMLTHLRYLAIAAGVGTEYDRVVRANGAREDRT